MKPTQRILAVLILTAGASLAAAQSTAPGQSVVAGKIASNYGTLAGSPENALNLVNALRNGTDVTLTTVVPPPTGSTEPPTTTTTTFTPPTGQMGWGNVKHALALAQDALAKAGVTNPTAQQLQTALVGGDVVVTNADGTTSTTTMKGVLTMRASGMGWGNIAKAGGTTLGAVTRQVREGEHMRCAADARAQGRDHGRGVSAAPSKGLVTASGATAGTSTAPKGNAYGRGIVTAASGAAVNVSANGGGKPSGAGVVNASGGSAAAVSNGGGNGNAKGHDKGGGKPGG